MIVYHVTTWRKLNAYLKTGAIKPPVRAWACIQQAQRFSIGTGRRLIVRLRFPANAEVLEGHLGLARVLREPYPIKAEDL